MTRVITKVDEISGQYEGFLFDAYGVLFDDRQMISGAKEVWEQLKLQGKSLWILTNGSSKTVAEAAAAYRAKGLDVSEEQIINSASLLGDFIAEQGLQGSRTAVLGTASSASYVSAAGAMCVDPLKDDFEVLVVANQGDYPFVPTLDQVISRILERYDRGLSCTLILTNPDFIYPKDRGQYGFTAGCVALLIEAALRARLGPATPRFERLGKPFPRIYAEAVRRAGTSSLLMVGDQLETDIRGAQNFGLDSLLVGTGLVNVRTWQPSADDPRPTYILEEWS